MHITAEQIAELIDGTIEGDGKVAIRHPAKIEEAGPGSITFLGNMKYEQYAYETAASALLVSHDFIPKRPLTPTLIRVPQVYTAVSRLLAIFQGDPGESTQRRISDNALVHDSSQLAAKVRIGKFTVVEEDCTIGENTLLLDQVYVGARVKIGANCIIYPGVKILSGCVIGDDCVLHANCVIGSDGFGFAPNEEGTYEKVPQVGNVVLHNRVEIGSNTTIDRATMGSTIIHEGVKLDNLIQIGHNVEIGRNTVVAAQTGIAGSTKIGADCRIGGQVGFVGHVTIADRTQIQAQSGIAASVEQPGTALFGSPAIDYKNYLKSYAVFKQLPDLYRQIGRLEKKLAELEK